MEQEPLLQRAACTGRDAAQRSAMLANRLQEDDRNLHLTKDHLRKFLDERFPGRGLARADEAESLALGIQKVR